MKYLKNITGDIYMGKALEVIDILYKCQQEGGRIVLDKLDVMALLYYIETIQGNIFINSKVTPSA